MKCSLKDGFVSILLIITIIAPSEGLEFPLSPGMCEPMNLRQFRAALCRLQDSFPNDGDFENTLHKIVKKQMAVSDSGDFREKSKRSVFGLPFCECDGARVKGNRKKAVDNFEILKPSKYSKNSQKTDIELLEDFVKKVKKFSRKKRSVVAMSEELPTYDDDNKEEDMMDDKEILTTSTIQPPTPTPTLTSTPTPTPTPTPIPTPTPVKPPEMEPEIKPNKSNTTQASKEEEKQLKKIEKENPNVQKCFMTMPDSCDHRFYYEFETSAYGCIKIKHKRCPDGEFFSCKHRKCMKFDNKKSTRKKRHLKYSKRRKKAFFPNPTDDSDPSNEWLDASQGSKIPPEFKPLKKPELKIFHLIMQKKLNEFNIKKRDAGGAKADPWRNMEIDKSKAKRQEPKTRRAKSFIIRIHKKGGKDESVAETDENEEKDDEEENDDEDDDEDEGEDEEEESDDDVSDSDIAEKNPTSSRETIRELIKSAKEAVTNRARFNEEPLEPKVFQKSSFSKSKKSDVDVALKSKKSERSEDVENNKKVLIDANIKVDSALSNALKSVLKSGEKISQSMNNNMPIDDEALISDRGSQDQLDPELIRMYEHLLRHNPRVKRYYLANRKGIRKV